MSAMRLLCIIVYLLLTSTAPAFADAPVNSKKWTDKYDNDFRKYSKRYFGPFFDWHWFKAQAIAESGLNENAESPVGAIGLMQIMPSTFADINMRNPHYLELDIPRWNIAAGIYYDRALYKKFPKSPERDKMLLALASYNAGYGRLLNAKKRIKSDRILWEEAKAFVPRETRGYVHRIKGLMLKE